MPTRVIRGDLVSSRSLSLVSRDARLTFVHLLLTVDDFGRLDARLPFLRSALFPVDEDVTPADLRGWLRELEEIPDSPIAFYEADGAPYLHLPNWEKHRSNGKRAKSSRYPDPPPIPADPRGSPQLPEDIRPSGKGTSGKGTSGKGTNIPPASPSSCVSPTTGRKVGKNRPKPKTDFPTDGSPDRLELEMRLASWADEKHPELSPRQLTDAVETVELWARGKGERRPDWLATTQGAIRRGWALEGAGGPWTSPAKRKVDATMDAARQVLAKAPRAK